MPIESKTKNLNWPALQGTVLGGSAYTLERFASADENAATFETHAGGERTLKALVRLAQADEETSEQQLLVWQAIKRSGHPNLIPIWGTGRARINGTSLIYVVTEASEENLANVLEERALDTTEAGEILVSLVGALGHLHSHGLVQGGLSPEQVMAVGESVKVATGGVRRVGSLTGLHFSKPKYHAPESFEGNISPAADIWCLGATLVQALTQRVCDENCVEEAAKLPAPFDAIGKSCLQKDPVARGTLSHLLALYEGRATNAPIASLAGTATKTMAAAAGSSRGSISFDWDADDEPQARRGSAMPVYMAPGPIVPEGEAFAMEAAGAGPGIPPPVEASATAKEALEKAVPVAAVASTPEAEESVTAAAAQHPAVAETAGEEAPTAVVATPPEETAVAAPSVAYTPLTSNPQPVEMAPETPKFEASGEIAPLAAETPRERTPFPAWMPARANGETDSRAVDERDPVAAANARLVAWREAAAAAMRADGESKAPPSVRSAAPEEIQRAKRRAWVFVAVALLILMAVIWVLRPSRSANKTARSTLQTTHRDAASRDTATESKTEQRVHGRTMTLPAAGQTGQPDAPNMAAPMSAHATEPSRGREVASAPAPGTAAAKTEDSSQDVEPAGRGPVWRVILYTYHREADAKRRVVTINRRHPDLNAQVFTPNGAGKSPFLVSLGGSTDRDVVAQLRHTAMRFGLPRDSYLQNYSR